MNININIVSVDESTQMSKANKPMQFIEVTYKDQEGRAKSKKIYEWTMKSNEQQEMYKALLGANKGDRLSIHIEKVGEFWEWLKLAGDEGADEVYQGSAAPAKPYAAPPKANNNVNSRGFETPEERAARQVYIIRQSSIERAIDYCRLTGEKVKDALAIMQLAELFADYVQNGVPSEKKFNNIPETTDSEDATPAEQRPVRRTAKKTEFVEDIE